MNLRKYSISLFVFQSYDSVKNTFQFREDVGYSSLNYIMHANNWRDALLITWVRYESELQQVLVSSDKYLAIYYLILGLRDYPGHLIELKVQCQNRGIALNISEFSV